MRSISERIEREEDEKIKFMLIKELSYKIIKKKNKFA